MRKLVVMDESDRIQSAPVEAEPANAAPRKSRVALVLGANGALSQEFLAQLVDDASYAWVHVGLRHSLGSATPKYRPWLIGRSTIVADDAFVFLTDLSRPAAPSPVALFGPTDLLRAAALARDAGVRRLLAVAPSDAPLASQSDSLRVMADEPQLLAIGFETLVMVRSTAGDAVSDGPTRRAGLVGRLLSTIARPMRHPPPPPQVAATALREILDCCGKGMQVLAMNELTALATRARPAGSAMAHGR